jgi:hypothetical protein
MSSRRGVNGATGRGRGVIASLALAAALTMGLGAGNAARAAPPASCDVRLAVQLTPDAASTRNHGFLTSLVADPQYDLRWIQGDDTIAIVELIGPGSDDQCSEGVNRLGRSSHVVTVRVLAPGTDPELALAES